MKYVAIFHANLNYAYLTEARYEFVIRSAYAMTLDVMTQEFPGVPFVFEASGYTIEHMAAKTPDVLEKLKAAIRSGQCEFMGSPHAHPMLPNFPEEDGLWSLKLAVEAYRKHLGIRPRSFWNPECGWRDDVPRQVLAAGYKNLLGDFEAYSRSRGPDGEPNRPEIYDLEHSEDPAFYSFGFKYDLPGDDPDIHFPFARVAGVPGPALRCFLRTDRIAQFGVRFFMGMKGYTLDRYLALIRKYSAQPKGEPEGALIIFADDAEYIGTNGWFRLKYENKPDNVFEATPRSRENLIALVKNCLTMGAFCTFDDACRLKPLDKTAAFDDDSAWHGARASTWARTPMAQLLRPWQDLVRAKLKRIGKRLDARTRRQVWLHLTNSFNSDGQWPPTLPDAPHIIHPFNYRYNFENLLAAETLVGGINRERLTLRPADTLKAILWPQAKLVLKKARARAGGTGAAARRAALAVQLLKRAMDVTSVAASGARVLYPAEYTVRAEALVEARRLVGGIEIEKT
jgi:hypothetical protein